MAIYRKVYMKMYADEKFRRLTPPPPCGQSLWVYLLTGPYTNAIPGVLMVGELALTEALGWPLKGFQKALKEITDQGMAFADWKHRLIFIPKAIALNAPESPNVIRSWAPTWEVIPECALKDEIHKRMKQYISGFGEGFRKALAEVFGEEYGESGTGTGTGTGTGSLSPRASRKKTREEIADEATAKANKELGFV